MDDYITGVEQVGMDPTVAVETVSEVDTKETVDLGTDAYDFKEYDLKEYDEKEILEKQYDYDYNTDPKPTSAAYEEVFGPGVPAETDFRESSVSAGAGVDLRGERVWRSGMQRRWWWRYVCGVVCGTFCLLSLTASDRSLEHARMHARTRTSTEDKYTRTHTHTHLVYPTD